MPYKQKKVKGGYKNYGPSGAKSKKPLSKEMANKQMAALNINAPPGKEDLSKMTMRQYRKAREGKK